MTIEDKIKKVIKDRDWNHRKYQYKIIAEVSGIDEYVAKEVCSLQRIIRYIIPKDEIGEELEKEWHKTEQIHNFENEMKPRKRYLGKGRYEVGGYEYEKQERENKAKQKSLMELRPII